MGWEIVWFVGQKLLTLTQSNLFIFSFVICTFDIIHRETITNVNFGPLFFLPMLPPKCYMTFLSHASIIRHRKMGESLSLHQELINRILKRTISWVMPCVRQITCSRHSQILFKPETRERAPEIKVVISNPGCSVVTTVGAKRSRGTLKLGYHERHISVEVTVPNIWV